jgi:Uncharacterised nucleotidyltransferase
MKTLEFSAREDLLLNAALNPDASLAVENWKSWASQMPLENVPLHELRLLPAIYAHLNQIAPNLTLPNKLRGKAKAIFTRNSLVTSASLPTIRKLSRQCPVMLTKGLAICLRFNAWSSRPMADVDIHVPLRSLETACRVLEGSGWIPRYGMTLPSIVHRSSLRRDSWNFTKGSLDIDLHWRLRAGPAENWLAQKMWASGERVSFRGETLVLQSAEFALLSSLMHGFLQGDRGDALQTVIDAALLLPNCKADELHVLLSTSDLSAPFKTLISTYDRLGLSAKWAKVLVDRRRSNGRKGISFTKLVRHRSRLRPNVETSLLRWPISYRIWEMLGRRPRLERLMLRLAGPFSRPLNAPSPDKDDYDLRDCKVIDEIGGPGWSWPEPDHSCFWSDRPDARLLVPLRRVGDYLLVLRFADTASSKARIDIFANGIGVATIDFKQHSAAEYSFLIPRHILFGPWIELSFRRKPYRDKFPRYKRSRGAPFQWLRVLDLAIRGSGASSISIEEAGVMDFGSPTNGLSIK